MIPCQRHLFDIPEDVAYLNTAYMSPLLTSVVSAIESGSRLKANPWKLKISNFFDDIEEARDLFSTLMHTVASNIAIIPSASYGVQTAANNLHIPEESKILVLSDQFPSNVYPWRRIAERKGAEIKTVNVPDGEAATDHIINALDERVSVCATANVLWTNGSLIDLEKVKAKCLDCNAELVVDLTQSAGAFDIDLSKIDPAFGIVANYKWMLGPYSTGFLYVSPKYHGGQPLEEGWITRKNSKDFAKLVDYQDQYEPGAIRYDMGQRSNFSLVPGVLEALRQIRKWGIANIQNTLYHSNLVLCKNLSDLGLQIPRAENRGPHFIGAKLPSEAPTNILETLAEKKIFISERGGNLRITPHLWNNTNDFERFTETLRKIL
jgi:selenocysteine lyase/cysteine desulfurase